MRTDAELYRRNIKLEEGEWDEDIKVAQRDIFVRLLLSDLDN